MPIATKNNAIIVKDGKVAENCDCCGGWYCCAGAGCLANPSSVSVSIEATDFYEQATMKDSVFPEPYVNYQSSSAFLGAFMNGTYSLTKSSLPPTDGRAISEWNAQIPNAPHGCDPFSIKVSLSNRNIFRDDIILECDFLYLRYASPADIKQQGELSSCSVQPQAASRTQGYYSVWRQPLWFRAMFPQCVDGNAHTAIFSRSIVLPASRGSDEKYSFQRVSLNSTSGNSTALLTVSITA